MNIYFHLLRFAGTVGAGAAIGYSTVRWVVRRGRR